MKLEVEHGVPIPDPRTHSRWVPLFERMGPTDSVVLPTRRELLAAQVALRNWIQRNGLAGSTRRQKLPDGRWRLFWIPAEDEEPGA